MSGAEYPWTWQKEIPRTSFRTASDRQQEHTNLGAWTSPLEGSWAFQVLHDCAE
ncbi:MAG: hypothetical protein ACYDFT_00350 [Thermoplasmata archaeon]